MPIVHLTFGDITIKCLVDTGASTSIIKPNILKYPLQKLDEPISYNSMAGISTVEYSMITPFPKEFNYPHNGTLSWKVFALNSKKYDAIIGVNFLTPLKSTIDLTNKCIRILHKEIIFFQDYDFPFNIDDICELNAIDINKDIISKIDNPSWNDIEKTKLKNLINSYKHLFYGEGDHLTFTHEIQHEIKLTSNEPIQAKIYRYPYAHEKEIKNQIDSMLEQGIIRESNSPYNSPLWIVPKKSDNSGIQKYRIVIDYRKLNDVTIDDKYPIPNIDGILDKLGRAQYFSTLDLAKGFHQIMVSKNDQKLTAFSTPFGHYEYVRMPFGLKNAPSTFQRLMNSVLRKYINKICVVYMDDILIFSTSIEEHVESIRLIFDELTKANLKIQIDKCSFFRKETEYLGHILTDKGVSPNPSKVAQISKLQIPKTQKQIKCFLGMTGYYRKFIQNYSKIAYPMVRYLKKDNSNVNILDPLYVSAFEQLKSTMITNPILKYPDFKKPFEINTDASNYALGAVLLQDGQPVSYASRTLNDHEIKYSTTEKEMLAVVWSIKHFRPYVYGKQFKLNTDHQALKWLHTKFIGQNLNPRIQRWILSLGEYDISIEYIKGKTNTIADLLSRINNTEIVGSTEIHDTDECMATDSDQVTSNDTIVNRFNQQIIVGCDQNTRISDINNFKRIYINCTSDNQFIEIDELIKSNFLGNKIAVFNDSIDDTLFQDFVKHLCDRFKEKTFIICKYFAQDVHTEDQLIKIVSINHKEYKHPGIIALYQKLRTLVYHKDLKIVINKVTNNCDICNRAKYDRNPIKPKFKLTEIPKSKNEIVHIDTYVNSKQPFLVFIDKFTKFAAAYPLNDKNHQTLIDNLSIYISLKKPIKIVADNEFGHVNIKQYLKNNNIELHLTKPNSHTGNSDLERLNNTITEKIRILRLESTDGIKLLMQQAIRSYNHLYHSTIKLTPYEAENSCKPNEIYTCLLEAQEKRLKKANRNREEYKENRETGYIKNYKSVRHKQEPKFRKSKLNNIHPINIKRPLLFTGQNDHINTTVNDNTVTNHGNNADY